MSKSKPKTTVTTNVTIQPVKATTTRCEVHDGYAPAVKRVTWNGAPRWVCQTCLDGR